MKKLLIITIVAMLVVTISLTGCYTPPRYTSESQGSAPVVKEVEVKETDLGMHDKIDETDDMGEMDEREETGPADVETVLKEPEVSETDIPKPDCDGRLIPTYNFRNEITGYRCMTDSADFECPGHRAGDTWEQDGAECTCKSNGEVVCKG